MGFVGEKIRRNSEARKYVASKGFTYISGKLMDDADAWAIDKERDIILVLRGGGGPEIPELYGLYVDGFLIDIEEHKEIEGDYFGDGIKIHWFITRISVPKAWFENGCGIEKLSNIIKEAFTTYSYIDRNPSQVLEVTVEINADPVQKYNSKGEEV